MRYGEARAYDAEPQTYFLQQYGTPGPDNTYESVSHRIYDLSPSIMRNMTTAVPITTKALPFLDRPLNQLITVFNFSIYLLHMFFNCFIHVPLGPYDGQHEP